MAWLETGIVLLAATAAVLGALWACRLDMKDQQAMTPAERREAEHDNAIW